MQKVMHKRWLGLIVSSNKVTIVDAEIPVSGSIIIQGDHSWALQKGDRASAYCIMHQHIADYVRENNIDRVIIKASALSMGSTKKAHLEAAELRGVVICAAASVTKTQLISKAHISRTFGDRKVDDYIADNMFWSKELEGAALRVGSREAAMVLLAARNSQ
jgi:hypothetical protein